MEPLVSVVIPIYKVEPYLSRCVDSVLRQTYQNFEIILVDDGSPDRCGEICDRYVQQDSRISVIHKVNGGLSSARNAGIDAAKGEWLMFVDSDDLIVDRMIELLLTACLEDGTKAAVGGTVDRYPEKGTEQIAMCPQKREVLSAEACNGRLMVHEGSDYSACNKLFHASVFRDFRFPLGVISEDLAIMYRVIHAAGRISMVPAPVYYYCHHADTITTTQFAEKNFATVDFTEKILEWTREVCPGILPSANVMYVRAMMYTMIWISRGTKEFREDHADRYDRYRREMRRLLTFTLRSSYFTGKQKGNAALLAWGMFPLVDEIRSRKKNKK